MNVGTRSVLYGAHQFLIHPCFVAAAWWRLYGFPRDPRLWLAFFVHDLGYAAFRTPNMDGAEGERHPEFGAAIMRIFGAEWRDLVLYHSRFYAKTHGRPFSRLCVADKLAFCLTPRWLYLTMAGWTGEIDEYMALAEQRTAAGEPKYASMQLAISSRERWHAGVAEYMRRWVAEHVDGRADTWTPDMGQRVADDESGVWR